jgi:hypothetical protein
MRLDEIYDPLMLSFSDKKHYKKPGAPTPRTAHTSGDSMEFDALTQDKIPKLTPQLKKKVDAASVPRSVVSQRLTPKRLLFL